MNRTVAKIGNEYIVVQLDSQGQLTAKLATDLEKSEIALFEASDFLSESTVSKAMEQAYDEIIKAFKADIKGAVAKSMGFSIEQWRGGRTEVKVDHCNSRMSDVSKVIDAQVKEAVIQMSKEAMPIDDRLKSQIQRACALDFKDRLEYKVREVMRSKVDSYINDQVEAYLIDNARPMIDKMIKDNIQKLVESKMKRMK